MVELLLVPLALVTIFFLLMLTAWLEDHVVSPRALIVRSVRASYTSPEIAERLAAAECERILSRSEELQRS